MLSLYISQDCTAELDDLFLVLWVPYLRDIKMFISLLKSYNIFLHKFLTCNTQSQALCTFNLCYRQVPSMSFHIHTTQETTGRRHESFIS